MVDQIRVKGGVLLGALVSGALSAGTLGGAPTANASCASFFGIGNSTNCTSDLFGMAIAIGTGAVAHADGTFNIATAVGNYAAAETSGLGSIATQFGAGEAGASGLLDVAISSSNEQTLVEKSNYVLAHGAFDTAINMGGLHVYMVASGTGNIAENFGGTYNDVRSEEGGGNVVFNISGFNNIVRAGPGPLAIAGAIGLTQQLVTQASPGININNGKVGLAAAPHSAKTAAPTATAVRTGKGTAAATAATHTGKQKTAPAATATSRAKR